MSIHFNKVVQFVCMSLGQLEDCYCQAWRGRRVDTGGGGGGKSQASLGFTSGFGRKSRCNNIKKLGSEA